MEGGRDDRGLNATIQVGLLVSMEGEGELDDRGLNATIQVGLLVSMEGEGGAMIEA